MLHEETHRQRYRRTTFFARKLRKNMTDAETILWEALRRKQCGGLKFKRQVPMGPYIVDFLCRDHRIVIEVDGDIHEKQKDYDAWRSGELLFHGYRVLRFSNNRVLGDLPAVLQEILRSVQTP